MRRRQEIDVGSSLRSRVGLGEHLQELRTGRSRDCPRVGRLGTPPPARREDGLPASRRAGATFGLVLRTPPALPVWRGLPSGEVFAELVRELVDRSGVSAHVDVTAWELQGAYGVSVDWQSGDAMYEVADWVDGARVLDTGDVLFLE